LRLHKESSIKFFEPTIQTEPNLSRFVRRSELRRGPDESALPKAFNAFSRLTGQHFAGSLICVLEFAHIDCQG